MTSGTILFSTRHAITKRVTCSVLAKTVENLRGRIKGLHRAFIDLG